MNTQIVFIEHNPFMSVELLDLVKNYQILCYNDDDTYRSLYKEAMVHSYGNRDFANEPESDKAAEIMLSDNKLLSSAKINSASSRLLFFYMNERMDKLVRRAGLKIALPKYCLQEKLGSKIFLSSICRRLNISENENIVYKNIPDDIDHVYVDCKEKLGAPFIVQGGQGESGWDTSLVSTKEDFISAVSKTRHGLRLSRYIKLNIPLSVHVCITDREIYIRGPWLQLIGLPELSCEPFRFSGNDTNQSLLNEALIQMVRDMSLEIASYAKEEGYKGILGIDYLWDKATDTIYPQEINSRLVGLTRLLTGIQKDQSLTPDIIRHLQAFTSTELTKKCQKYIDGEIDLRLSNYSQVIIRHNAPDSNIVVNRIQPGIYRVSDGCINKVSNSLFVDNIKKNEFLVTYGAHKNSKLERGMVIARIILKQSVMNDHEYILTDEARNLINIIRHYAFSASNR